jgi:hypothetical protein
MRKVIVRQISLSPTVRHVPYLHLSNFWLIRATQDVYNQEDHVTDELFPGDNPATNNAQYYFYAKLLPDFNPAFH